MADRIFTEEHSKIVNEMVRDFTSVYPRSKSEVRRRLLDLFKIAWVAGINQGEEIFLRTLEEELKKFREGFAYRPKK